MVEDLEPRGSPRQFAVLADKLHSHPDRMRRSIPNKSGQLCSPNQWGTQYTSKPEVYPHPVLKDAGTNFVPCTCPLNYRISANPLIPMLYFISQLTLQHQPNNRPARDFGGGAGTRTLNPLQYFDATNLERNK